MTYCTAQRTSVRVLADPEGRMISVGVSQPDQPRLSLPRVPIWQIASVASRHGLANTIET